MLLVYSQSGSALMTGGERFGEVGLVLGAILIVDGAVCFWGAWLGFPAGALLSVSALAEFALAYSKLAADGLLLFMVIGAVAVFVNVLAARTKPSIAEQANPMNLPVFG